MDNELLDYDDSKLFLDLQIFHQGAHYKKLQILLEIIELFYCLKPSVWLPCGEYNILVFPAFLQMPLGSQTILDKGSQYSKYEEDMNYHQPY